LDGATTLLALGKLPPRAHKSADSITRVSFLARDDSLRISPSRASSPSRHRLDIIQEADLCRRRPRDEVIHCLGSFIFALDDFVAALGTVAGYSRRPEGHGCRWPRLSSHNRLLTACWLTLPNCTCCWAPLAGQAWLRLAEAGWA
jgi:hypothetical protein